MENEKQVKHSLLREYNPEAKNAYSLWLAEGGQSEIKQKGLRGFLTKSKNRPTDRKPYLSSGKKEGVRWYAVFIVLLIPAILGFWFYLLAGGFGPDRSVSVPTLQYSKPTIEARYDKSKELEPQITRKPERELENGSKNVSQNAVQPTLSISPTPTTIRPTDRPTGDVIAIPAQPTSTPYPVQSSGYGSNTGASIKVDSTVEPRIITYYAPGYEWMQVCEGIELGSDAYWACLKDNEPASMP